MEGFLLKKGRGESAFFGRKNWKKRWFILEGTYITYYEDFSLEKDAPINKKGTCPVRGCTVEPDPKSKKFGFVLKHETRKPLYMAAETDKIMNVWMKALKRAATGKVGPTTINFDEFFDSLGMERGMPYTKVELNKFYRKAALKNHPDKGGDVDAFKRIQEAFDILKAKVEEEEEEKLWTTMDYLAVIEKGPAGIGFGMVVVEDAAKAQIIAKKVMDKMMLVSIDSSSGGNIKAKDQIIAIDGEDITSWTLQRVVQRLSDFRTPIGKKIQFTFRRRVRIDGDAIDEDVVNNDFEEDERLFREQQERQMREEEEAKRHMAGSDIPKEGKDINEIDTDDDCEVDSQFDDNADGSPQPRRSISFDTRKLEQSDDLRKLEREREEEKNKKRQSWAQKDPMVHIACLEAENEEIEKELRDVREELSRVRHECNSFKKNYHDALLDLEDVKEEAHMFLEQLEAAELECQTASRRELAAMDVINQLSGSGGEMSAELSQEFLKNIQQTANMVENGYDLTGEYGYGLDESANLPKEQSVEYSLKNAFSAATLVDRTGVFSQKYSVESLSDNLVSRLENSLSSHMLTMAKNDGDMGWYDEDLSIYPGQKRSEAVNIEHSESQKHVPIRAPPPPPQTHKTNVMTHEKNANDHFHQSHYHQFQEEYKPDYNQYPNMTNHLSELDQRELRNGNFSSYFQRDHVFQEHKDNFNSNTQTQYLNHGEEKGYTWDRPSRYNYSATPQVVSTAPIKFGPRKKKTKSKK